MKRHLLTALMALFAIAAFAQKTDGFKVPAATDEAQAWFKKGNWRQGWKVKPYAAIDVQTFYEQYQKAPAMYDSIFAWLKSIDPIAMNPSKEVMVWSHAHAICQDLDLRTPENTQWEQHHRTIDLQWVVTGSERLGVTRSPEALDAKNQYNEKKDVQNFKFHTAPKPAEYLILDSRPKEFYLFFPTDIHTACGIAERPETVRKIVVKIEVL